MMRVLVQTVAGDGTAFLAAMGTVMTKELAAGEKMVVDTHSLVAWSDTVTLDIRSNGGLCTCCCGGEGMFSTVLIGPGTVFFQSTSLQKFKTALRTQAAQRNGGGGGGGFGGPAVEEISR